MFKKFFIIILFFPLLTITKGQGWEWQNPLPQGNTLGKVFFSDSAHGWIMAGCNMLKTINKGERWTVEHVIDGFGPTCVFFTDSLNGWAAGNGDIADYNGYIIRTSDGGSTWKTLQLFKDVYNILDIYFLNNQNGFFVDDLGKIYKTNDAGVTWQARSLNIPAGRSLKTICFVDSLKGWTAGDTPLYFTNDGGNSWNVDNSISGDQFEGIRAKQILFCDSANGWILNNDKLYHTINSGRSWELQMLLNSVTNSIFFLNPSEGWISTGNGFYHTTDSGRTWDNIFNKYSINSLWFINSHSGFATGGSFQSEYFMTKDGGITWQNLLETFTRTNFFGVHFIDSQKGWVCGSNGRIFYTQNGGKSWAQQETGVETTGFTDNWLFNIRFIDPNFGWAVGRNGIILHTTNGGTKWVKQESGTSFQLNQIFILNADEAWTVGLDYTDKYSGVLLHTANGGLNWQNKTPENIQGLRGIFFKDQRTGWITTGGPAEGDEGNVYKTTDGGESWQIVHNDASDSYGRIIFTDSLNGWIAGNYGLLFTTDGGNTWTMNNVDVKYGILNYVFSGSKNGWVTDIFGGIFRTQDGGVTWQRQSSSVSSYNLEDIFFINSQEGWAVGGNGTIIHTVNGGTNYVFPSVDVSTFNLFQNYPNPFNNQTYIKYNLLKPGNVTITIFNILGEKVTILVNNKYQTTGTYNIMWDAQNQSSGVFIYQVNSGDNIKSGKMLLLK